MFGFININQLKRAWYKFIKPEIDKKLDSPIINGFEGQVLTKTSKGVEWKDIEDLIPKNQSQE